MVLNALQYAASCVGTRETGGHNRGPLIDELNRYVGIPLGSSYCAAGVSYSFHRAEEVAGVQPGLERILKTGSSQAFKRFAQREGLFFTDPQYLQHCKGALFGWTNPNDPAHGHIGFCELRLRHWLTQKIIKAGSVEFNTDGAGSANGDGVWRRTRNLPIDHGVKLWFIDTTPFIGGQWWK